MHDLDPQEVAADLHQGGAGCPIIHLQAHIRLSNVLLTSLLCFPLPRRLGIIDKTLLEDLAGTPTAPTSRTAPVGKNSPHVPYHCLPPANENELLHDSFAVGVTCL